MKQWTVLLILLILGALGTLSALKYLTHEGRWVCINDTWVAQGDPRAPKPQKGCGTSATSEQNVVEEYIRAHITELSPQKAVLGGTFFVTRIDVLDEHNAVVEYEDGHIALVARVTYGILNNNVTIEHFTNIEDSFVHQGNLVMNNPGLKQETWYLNYDLLGAPATIVELMFTKDSRCGSAQVQEQCTTTTFTPGSRVRVYGSQLRNGTVEVRKIEF